MKRSVTWEGPARDVQNDMKEKVWEALKRPKLMFASEDDAKEKVWEALRKPEYNVVDFYHKTGIWRRIATHPVFENLTLAVICMSSLWMWIDTDNNPASTLLDAQPVFQIVEHFFCWYFFFEWYVRFSAFKRKPDGLKDGWFVFDSCLAFVTVADTWVMTAVLLGLDSGGGASITGASILRMFRLLRLSRMARMLRSMPELMILIKGMLAASRSVFFTMCLLVILLYFFAIMMRQLTDGTPVGQQYFYSVPASMYLLLIEGVFLDKLDHTVKTIAASGAMYAVVFFVFVMLAALMVMNMLIGVLCEVVSRVATTEKEEMSKLSLQGKLARVMDKLDQNNNGMLSEMEFVQLVSSNESVKLLDEVGVDPIGLINLAPSIFNSDEDEQEDEFSEDEEQVSKAPKEINFKQFMDIVLDHRGSTTASLKDLRELKHDLVNELENLKVKLNVSKRRGSSRRGSLGSDGFSRQTSVASEAASMFAEPLGTWLSDKPTLRRTQSCSSLASFDPPSGMRLSDQPASPLGLSGHSFTQSKTPKRLDRLLRSKTTQSLVESHSELGSSNEVDLGSGCSSPCWKDACRSHDEGTPSPGERRDCMDMQEVEGALRFLQAALMKVQRPGLPGVAGRCHDKNMLDWVDSMSKTAASELEAIQKLQAPGTVEVPYDHDHSEHSTMASLTEAIRHH